MPMKYAWHKKTFNIVRRQLDDRVGLQIVYPGSEYLVYCWLACACAQNKVQKGINYGGRYNADWILFDIRTWLKSSDNMKGAGSEGVEVLLTVNMMSVVPYVSQYTLVVLQYW